MAIRIESRFLHNDLHGMDLMCTGDGAVLAIIDWGDAGWGDTTLEFAQVSVAAVPSVMAGYESDAGDLLGTRPEARILWDKLEDALDALPRDIRVLDELTHFIRTADPRWRRALGL